MAMEFVVAARLSLPGNCKTWDFQIDNEEGQIEAIDVEKYELDYYGGSLVINLVTDQTYFNEISRLIPQMKVEPFIEKSSVEFLPSSLFNIRPQNWELSGVIAYSLCRALGGIVIAETLNDCPYQIIFESGKPVSPPSTIGELERILWVDFLNPEQIIEQWAKEDSFRTGWELENFPELLEQRRKDNDWSDV